MIGQNQGSNYTVAFRGALYIASELDSTAQTCIAGAEKKISGPYLTLQNQNKFEHYGSLMPPLPFTVEQWLCFRNVSEYQTPLVHFGL